MKKLLFFIASSIFTSAFSQQKSIGINTASPTTTLDVNGNVRIRTIPLSTSSMNTTLVVDEDGVIKKNIRDSKGILRAYLSQNFSAPQNSGTIYKVLNWNVIDDPNNDFDASTGLFKAPVKGLYKITYTATIQLNGDTPSTNIVVGVVNNDTGKWITRFSIIKVNTTASDVGNAYTFVGLVKLEANQQAYFGATGYTNILSFPSGTTGEGIGTFFEVELIKNES